MPGMEDPRSAKHKALADEWAAMCDRIPNDIVFRKQLAIRCLMTKLNKRAWEQHERILAMEPDWAEGYINMAGLAEEGREVFMESEGDPKLALEVLERGYAMAGEAKMNAAGAAPIRRRLAARVVLDERRKASEANPQDYDALVSYAQASLDAGLWREAGRLFTRARELDPRRFVQDALDRRLREIAEKERATAAATRLRKDGTVAEMVEVARGHVARAEFREAQAWLKRAQERNLDAYNALGVRALHTRVQQVIDIVDAPERPAQELAERAMRAMQAAQWPYAVFLWRGTRTRDLERFRRVGGPARLAESEANMRQAAGR